MVRSRRRGPPPVRAAPLNAAMSARKSAPVSAGGVNVRRLMLSREAAMEYKSEEEEEEEGEKETNNECGNPFCRQSLTNRYARFCEDKPMCQRYRALKLQCLANAQAEEDEEDMRPLSHIIKKMKKKEEEKTFAIPRKKKMEGKRRLDLSADNEERRSNSNSPRQKEKMLREMEEKRQKKRMKKAKEADESNGTEPTPSRSPSVASSTSSVEEMLPLSKRLTKRLHSQDPRTRQPPEVSSDAETGTRAADVSRIKKRRLNRHVSADYILSRSASSSPSIGSAASAAVSKTNWKIPRAKPARPTTAAQAIKKMNVELVPLGVASQASLAGGGRYVQNGNRSTTQSLRPSDPRARPPTMTKFASPAVSPPPSAVPLSTSSRPLQTTQPTGPAPTLPQPSPLPPLPRQASSLAPPVSRPTGPARATTPLSSPAKTPAVASSANASSTTTTVRSKPAAGTGTPRLQRISASAYLKSRKSDLERRSQGERTDRPPSRSSSLERSASLTDDRGSGYPSAPAYPTAPPGYHRSDSAPLPSYRESRRPVDPRRQYPEADLRQQRPYYATDGNTMEYRDRPEGRGEPSFNDRSTSGQWESRSFLPPRDVYPSRQRELSSFGTSNGDYDYPVDTHISPASSPAEQPYWREPPRAEPPPPQRAPTFRRGEPERASNDRGNSALDELDVDAPTFSYHEDFLPRLLSIFIHKLPQSLEAVFNVTKKPRKMNWYIKYVERIERLCKPFDLQIKFDGLKALVTVRGREWLTLQGTSTVTLHLDVIKSLRAEAMTWLRFYEETEKALDHDRGIYGNQVNESYSFLRAWNDLKKPGNYVLLSRQSNYFCGARLHHWNFVIGKVEIGSGSHEEKREAFRLATVSALDFLLSIGRGVRRPSQDSEVKPERALESNRLNARGSHRSSSRESSASNRLRTSPANDEANGGSIERPSSAAPPSSSIATHPSEVVPPSTEQSSAENPTASTEPQPSAGARLTTQSQSSAESSSSPVTVERAEKPVVAIIPTTDSNRSHEVVDAAEQSDQGEEMSISDASDLGAVTPAGSPRSDPSTSVPPNAAGMPTASAEPVIASSPVPNVVASTSVTTDNSSTAPLSLTAPVASNFANKPPAANLVSASSAAATVGAGKSASNRDIPVSQTKVKTAVPPRRCMMCEMIRMRKPDGERCLRCQQKDAPANGVVNGP